MIAINRCMRTTALRSSGKFLSKGVDAVSAMLKKKFGAL
jgi:transcription termination factor Rho